MGLATCRMAGSRLCCLVQGWVYSALRDGRFRNSPKSRPELFTRTAKSRAFSCTCGERRMTRPTCNPRNFHEKYRAGPPEHLSSQLQRMRVSKHLCGAALASAIATVLLPGGQAAQFTQPALNADGSFQAQLATDPGRSYTLEVSTNGSIWTPKYVYENVGSQVEVLDPPGAEIGPVRFYRALSSRSPRCEKTQRGCM